MYQPIPIKATLLEPENLQRVRQIITEQDSATRWAISREVCEQFDFLDAKGQGARSQLSGCIDPT